MVIWSSPSAPNFPGVIWCLGWAFLSTKGMSYILISPLASSFPVSHKGSLSMPLPLLRWLTAVAFHLMLPIPVGRRHGIFCCFGSASDLSRPCILVRSGLGCLSQWSSIPPYSIKKSLLVWVQNNSLPGGVHSFISSPSPHSWSVFRCALGKIDYPSPSGIRFCS